MRSSVGRQRLVRAAAVGSTVLMMAACGVKPGPSTTDGTGGTGTGGLGAGLTVAGGTLIVSDGTSTVRVGDQSVTFPTTVTDAAVSPDGSRITYVDGDGNISVSRIDGTGRAVLTKAGAGVTRSRPTWQSAIIVFAEKRGDGTSTLRGVQANGCDTSDGPALRDVPMDTGDNTSYVDLAPSSQERAGYGYRLAFQHDEPGGPEVWIHDTVRRGPSTEKFTDGSEPAFSPDGRKLAYVGRNGQVAVRDLTNYQAPAVQVTTNAAKPTRLAWTPDGARIAFSTAADVESVAADQAGGNPTVLASAPGVPTFVRPPAETVTRITGADPIALAIAASQAFWPTVKTSFQSQGFSGAHTGILTAPGVVPGDISGVYGPLLLTAGGALDPRTHEEMKRLYGAWSDPGMAPRITIVGGTDVISAQVANELTGRGYQVSRVAAGAAPGPGGGDACSFQASLAQGLARQTLVVVNPAAPANLAVATSLAQSQGAPVLRVDPAAGLTDAAKEWLARSAPALNATYIVDPDGTGIPAELERQITDLISGPLGAKSQNNPTVPALN